MPARTIPSIVSVFFFIYYFTVIIGCKKEYSYESSTDADLTTPDDSAVIPNSTKAVVFPRCASCNGTDTSSMKWSFKVDSSLLCGNVTKAVLSSTGDAITIFGPSTCSGDTGLILTAFFPRKTFKRDQTNITADRASLEYYDNTTMADLLQSKSSHVFNLTIESYSQQARRITGIFNGFVVDKNARVIKVEIGKFNVRF